MLRYVIVLCLFPWTLFSQENQRETSYWDGQYYYGYMLRHNKNVAHLVTNQPNGFILSYNRRTNGEKYWQRAYNYPEWGASFIYQDFNTDVLERNFGLYGHYNFFFLNRNLTLRLGQGIAYNTNPFDIDTNFKNTAFGSHFMASTYVMLNFQKQRIVDGLGIRAGLVFVHHSNGSFKAPNTGTNILAANLGISYDFDAETEIDFVEEDLVEDFSEKITYNFVIRGGLNEGDIVGLGQHPFMVLTAFADKRLNYKSTIQFGVEAFFSKFLEKEIEYRALAFNSSTLNGDEDYKRVGIFAGHEFRLGDLAIPTQLGYYLYWPYEYELRVYSRVGVKYYVTDQWFGVATVKTHAANAEAIEFGIGIRL
ncbi:acyloxyacyl hydrolase [Aureisphaera galaxeae]|uniref:acyloxyacyl hydrolase n=1 Tax=Aureisphaera galaxeae TaxID=1538023 RepID=UPI0023503BBA|nr:acyloxyacyl hydrolase [Aureisphaera galaxeae]MDC8003160.1 acyloxyacyl hydrolase [Aureisphaera galaxeae]